MDSNISYSHAKPDDKNEIIELIKNCNLPYEDLNKEKIKSFIVAKSNNKIIGCIGIEIFDEHGLLRSLAVNKKFRNQKIGSELYNRLILFSNQSGIKTIHLLTTTAENFFNRKGFSESESSEAPEAIKNTIEFSALCPSSSTYMILQNL